MLSTFLFAFLQKYFVVVVASLWNVAKGLGGISGENVKRVWNNAFSAIDGSPKACQRICRKFLDFF